MNVICIFAAAIEFAIGPGTQEKPSAAFPLKIGEKPSAVWYDAEALHVGSTNVPWKELKVAPTNGAAFAWRATSADGEKITLKGRIDDKTARYFIPSMPELSEKRLDSIVRVEPRRDGTVKVSSRFKGPRSPIYRQFKQATAKAGKIVELLLIGDETTDLGFVDFALMDIDGARIFWTHEWEFRARDLKFALRSLHTDSAAMQMIVRTDNWFGSATNYMLKIEMDDFATGKRIWESAVPALPTKAPGNCNGNGIANQKVDVSALPPGEYKCHVTLVDPSGKKIGGDYRYYAKPDVKAPWEGTTYGAEDTVPPPWTKPVWKNDGFSCWNREVRFGGEGLVSSVISAGREILAAPVEVSWNGKPLKFASSLAKANVADAFYELKAEGAPVSARVRAEFDGVMWFELSYEPPVDSVSVAVPARRSEIIGFDDGMSMKDKTIFTKGRRYEREYDPTYAPCWWMGDVIGLMGGVDGWRGYHVKNVNGLFRVEADDSVVKMTTRIVDTPLASGDRQTAKFYLQATPTKPKNRDIAALPPAMIRSWTGHLGYFYEDRTSARLDLSKNEVFEKDKREGKRVFYYNATGGVSAVFPWWGWFGDDWSINVDSEIYAEEIPYRTEEDKHRSPWVRGCTNVKSFFEFKLKDICDFLWNKDLNIRDLYFDLTDVCVCWNRRHGCSFKDEFGHRKVGYGIASYHELLKRIYREMKKKNLDSAFLGHILRSRAPVENFFDALTMGEGYDRDICYSLSYYDVLTPDLMRMLYASRASEVTMRLLPQMSRAIKMYRGDLKNYDPNEPKYDRANRHAAAYFKIHDLTIVSSSVGEQWTKPDATLASFGRDRTHSAYYKADCPISVSEPNPRFLYAIYSGNGKKMLILLNDTDQDVKKTVSVKGLSGKGKDIFGNGTYDFASGSCLFELPPRESRFVLFE